MKAILRDFFRSNLSMLIREALITAICAVCLALTGMYTRENTRIAAIVITAFLALTVLRSLVQVLAISPCAFRKRLAELTEAERAEVLEGYTAAFNMGGRRIYKNSGLLLFFADRKLHLLRFRDIKSADLTARGVLLTLGGGKTLLMRAAPDETPELIWRLLRINNPEMTATVAGKEKSGAGRNIGAYTPCAT